MHLWIYIIMIIMLLGRIVPNWISLQKYICQGIQNHYWYDSAERQYKAGFSWSIACEHKAAMFFREFVCLGTMSGAFCQNAF